MGDHEAVAFYSASENKTVIHEEGRAERKIVNLGLSLLQMTTVDGSLNVQF